MTAQIYFPQIVYGVLLCFSKDCLFVGAYSMSCRYYSQESDVGSEHMFYKDGLGIMLMYARTSGMMVRYYL